MADPAGTTSAPLPPESAAGRIVVIDILRGLAILWVMTFHLWTDMTGGVRGVSPLYERLGDRVREGSPLPALTAAGEVVLGSGYQGVAVFMMLSGLSLTLNACRRGEPPALRGYAARFRKIVVPYWAGIAFALGVFALVAALQSWRDGGSVRDQWSNIHIGVVTPVHIRLGDTLWALTVGGWLFRERVPTPPVIGSLWFVPLLLQYYLLFPLALRVLRRIGPWHFALAAIAFTALARAAYIELAPTWIDAAYERRTLDMFAPFRYSEFLLGMSLGYLLVHGRAQMGEWVASPVGVVGLVVIGLMLQWASVSIDPGSALAGTPLTPMGHVALALFALPLLFKAPGRLEVSALAKALTFVGVISFTALIVDDGMRYVASFLRSEGAHGIGWWVFLWAVYIPGGTLLAYPMAKVLGLLPKRVLGHAAG